MGAKPVILLDDGGVMNDTRLRGPQYQRLVGDFFAPRLGGEKVAWAEANRICIASIFEPESWRRRVQAAVQEYGSFERGFTAAMVVRWLAVVLLLLFVVVGEREPLSSLGIRALRWRDVLLALVIGVLALVVGIALYLLVNGGPQTDASTQTGQILRALGLAGRIHLDVNAAVVEELFFRGLLIECLIRIFGRR
jgi:hypothetical protein